MSNYRALLSVYDKTGIVDLALFLASHGYELVSTGKTATLLREAGLKVYDVAEITGFPEMMDGRLKTLHPKIHGGILNRRDNALDRQVMQEHSISDIDIVVSNLYPFNQTVSDKNVDWDTAIEMIDIGGPSMLRAAAKNSKFVTVLCSPDDYGEVMSAITEHGEVPLSLRRHLAAKAIQHTAYYDSCIATWMQSQLGEGASLFPTYISVPLMNHGVLRYGENPHQGAAVYSSFHPLTPNLLSAKQLQGKGLSYNNLNDANAALEILLEFEEPTAVAVKHAVPCAVASAESISRAFSLCHAADPVSIYGGIVALNRPLDIETALQIQTIFLDILLAPSYDEEALEMLSGKKGLIIMELGAVETWQKNETMQIKTIRGGYLLQNADCISESSQSWEVVSTLKPSDSELGDALFAWKVVKHMRSNAIVVVKDACTLGLGQGQVNRVDAAKHALQQAGEKARGAIMASDGFIPFDDTMHEAGSYGIATIVEPGGSIRDDDCIRAADKLGLALIFTKVRHFMH